MGDRDLGRMPKAFRAKVMAFDPCWGREEWDALVSFLAGHDHESAVDELRDELESYTGSRVTLTNAGREAIGLSAQLLGLRRGDEVVSPDFACSSSISPLMELGCRPVAADIDRSLCLDPLSVESCIGERTRAVLMVQQFGRIQDVRSLRRLAADRDILLLDDSAPAFGSMSNDGPASTLGDAGILSFNYCKTISSIGGGALVGDLSMDELDLKPAGRKTLTANVLNYVGRRFRHLGLVGLVRSTRILLNLAAGRASTPERHLRRGSKARAIAGIQAKLALAQLRRFREMAGSRRSNYRIIRDGLEDVDGLELPTGISRGDVPLFLPLMVPEGHRWDLASFMAKNGYETTWDYPPLHLSEPRVEVRTGLPNTDAVWRRILLIPVHPNVREEQAKEMASLIRQWGRDLTGS